MTGTIAFEVGSEKSLPLSASMGKEIRSLSMLIEDTKRDRTRAQLVQYAQKICKSMEQTDLPPLRHINHRIPIIDENKRYSWRSSKCPEPLRKLWAEKKQTYIKSG